MTEMLDRVAKEIAAEIMELTASQRATFKFPDHANGDTIERARSAARLSIAAMREPTEVMWTTKDQPVWALGRPMWDWWRSMIDAALA
jgi:hypothetical protein